MRTNKSNHKNYFVIFGIFTIFILNAISFLIIPVQGTIIGDTPPSSGDWIIDSDTTVKHENIIWNSSIKIEESANVLFENTTIQFNTTSYEQIFVNSTGKVSFINCTFTAYDPDAVYYREFSIHIASDNKFFELRDSYIEHCGSSFEKNVLILGTSKILNNTFKDCYWGISFYGFVEDDSRWSIIKNNKFHNSTEYDLYLQRYDNVTLIGNKFAGTYQSDGGGFNISEANNITFSRNSFPEKQAYVYIKDFYNITDSVISDNNFIGDAMGCRIVKSEGVVVDGNEFRDNPDASFFPIRLMHSNNTKIRNNEFSDCSRGIYNTYSNYTLVASNQFSDMEHSAIQIREYSYNCNVSNNSILRSDEYGIFVYQSDSTLIENNNVRECAHQGIFNQYSDNSIIRGNTVEDNGWSGIDVSVSDGITIKNNDANDNGYSGIQLQDVDSGTVSDNIITGNLQDGLRIDGCTSITIDDNTIKHNYYDGVEVLGYSSDILIISNLIGFNEQTGVYINQGSSASLEGNTFETNGEGNITNENESDLGEILMYVGIAAFAVVSVIIAVKTIKGKRQKATQ